MSDSTDAPVLKKPRWDDVDVSAAGGTSAESSSAAAAPAAVPRSSRWGATATPRQAAADIGISRWGANATPTPSASSRLDGGTPALYDGKTPISGTPSMLGAGGIGQTPLYGMTPNYTGMMGSLPGSTPKYSFEGATPLQSDFTNTVTRVIDAKAEELRKEWNKRNRHLTDEALDALLPPEFAIVPQPVDYVPADIEEPNFYEKASQMPEVLLAQAGAGIDPASAAAMTYDIPENLGEGMPAMQPQDAPVFEILLRWHGTRDKDLPTTILPAVLVMRNLFKVKNGDTQTRRNATRYLVDNAKTITAETLFQYIFRVWQANIMGPQEQHFFVELIKNLITKFQELIAPIAKDVIHIFQTLLSHETATLREDGRDVLSFTMRAVGLDAVFAAIKDDFAHSEVGVRRHTAKVVSIVAFSLGAENAIAMINGVSQSPVEAARYTAARSIMEMANMLSHGISKHLGLLVPVFERLLIDSSRVKSETAVALCQTAEACAPYGIEHFGPLMKYVREECRRGVGSTAASFLRAFGSIVPLMEPRDAQQYTADIMPTLVNQFNTPEPELQRVMMNVVRRCVESKGVTPDFVRSVILVPFFSGFWSVRRITTDIKSYRTLVETTANIAVKVGNAEVLAYLVKDMKDDSEHFQRMVIEAVTKVVEKVGTLGVPDDLIRQLMDGVLTAFKLDDGSNRVVLDGVCALTCSLDVRLKSFLRPIFTDIKSRLQHTDGMVRMQAAELAARIAEKVAEADGFLFLQDLGRQLYEYVDKEEQAVALSSMLKALRKVLQSIPMEKYLPSVKDLLKKLAGVIKNRDGLVQLHCVELVEHIAEYGTDSNLVDPLQLQDIAVKGLFPLLDADRRETRRACARAFGVIARKIRPFLIVLKLIDNFDQQKRKIRICTAVALGVIAEQCGLFTIIPFLLNEYRACEGLPVAQIVQHSVLKAIRYMFEFTGSIGKDYVMPLVPLLERALTETSIQHRRMAVEAARAILMAVAGQDGFQDVTIHLLNFIYPNIVELLAGTSAVVGEERKKMIVAVLSFIEAARLIVGSAAVLQYLYQGMFHPSKKVCDIYRKTYNLVYHANPEGLLNSYPLVEDDERHKYQRHELYVLL
jgi:splicing factor 3B subunit 1